jgi:DNA-binding transcriptional MerR regulator
MMRIGEFARLSRVSVKTLQYYDELGLIKPARVDEFTGYRYYAHEQYERLNRLLALKDLGFSLEHIGQLLDGGLTTEEIRGMLILKASEIRQRLTEEQGKLARIDAWLTQLNKEDVMSEYEVIIKRVPSMKVATVRGVVPTPPDQDGLWEQALQAITDKRAIAAEPFIALYHDAEPQQQDWDIEVCVPLAATEGVSPAAAVKELSTVEAMVSVVHRGPFMTIMNAYNALWSWTEANGYQVAGPAREVLVQVAETPDQEARQVDPNTVVEVQMPVVRRQPDN